MIRRRAYKPVGAAEMTLGVMNPYSGFEWVRSANRAVLRRRSVGIVSRIGIQGLRWFNTTGAKRHMHQLKLRREFPRIVRQMRKRLPIKNRHPKFFRLY